jgi:hypothetical protein
MAAAAKTIEIKPFPGPQEVMLTRAEKEILYGGARGGGKTWAGIIWMLMPILMKDAAGNPRFPNYRGLVIRLHSEDLHDWIDRAEQVYKHFGGKKVGRPASFVFPDGQKILTNHLQNRDAVKKYQGHEYQRILLEEATHIPEEAWYEMLLASCRSTIPGLDAQILLSANPGGPGHQWVRNRFVRVFGRKDERGKWVLDPKAATKIPEGSAFYVPAMKDWRIFIPAKVDDNPAILENDPAYMAFLESLPDALKKAWRYGDWDAFAGQYFPEFRPYGPIGDEPPEARHVIPASSPEARLEPWWFRRIAMDWGYDHPTVVLWGCQNPNGRFHVYREFVVNQLGSVQVGVKIAEKSARDLEFMVEPTMVLHLDPTAFGKKDDVHTIPENIAIGIDKALGLGTARLVDMEGKVTNSQGQPAYIEEYRELTSHLPKKPQIIIAPASNPRIAGWLHVREQLRWTPLFPGSAIDEVLPKVVIHDSCPKLIDCLSILIHDEDDPEDVLKMPGDDPGDALRYLLVAHSGQTAREPFHEVMHRRLVALQAKYNGQAPPTVAYMVAQKAESDFHHQNQGALPVASIARPSSRRAKILRTLSGR